MSCRPESKPAEAPLPSEHMLTAPPPRPPTLADKLRSERSEQASHMTAKKTVTELQGTVQSEPTIAQLLFQRQQQKSMKTPSPPLQNPPTQIPVKPPAPPVAFDGPTPKEAASNATPNEPFITASKAQKKKTKAAASKDWMDAFQSSGLKVEKKKPVGISIVKMKSKPEEPSRPVYTPPVSLSSPPPGFDTMKPIGKKQRDAENDITAPPGFAAIAATAPSAPQSNEIRVMQDYASVNDPNVKLVDRSRSGWVSVGGANEGNREAAKMPPPQLGDTDYPQLTSVYHADKPAPDSRGDAKAAESTWQAKQNSIVNISSSNSKQKKKKKQANELMKLAFK